MTDALAFSHGGRVASTDVQGAVAARVAGLDWETIDRDLDQRGYALTGPLLNRLECAGLIADYERDELYRSRVFMKRHNFGLGEYRYFSAPLPHLVQSLRSAAYPHLAPLANRWAGRMKQDRRFPDDLETFLATCHEQGQTRPTPLILRYGEGDYNCLHQDLYGEIVFPLQLAVLLNDPGAESEGGDFEGGEFVVTEQRPRMQSRAEVVPLRKGEAVIFAVNERPVQGTRGSYRVKVRHGVSRLRAGSRHSLGVIFHDAS
jgi:hypothetical protein